MASTTEQYPKKDFYAHCGQCHHQWLVATIPMELGRFCSKLDGAVKMGCPKCDSRNLKVGLAPAPDAAPAT